MDKVKAPTFFIVSTPIGNLGDITYRAIDVLKSVDVILAEDTRSAITLLKHYGVPRKEIISFFEGNENQKLPLVLSLLAQNKSVALISEAGTPLVSDPGFKLLRELITLEINIESIPGPTAAIAAITTSGLPTNSFLFLGFLPKKESPVKKVLEETKLALSTLKSCKTVVLYESPHRILKSLCLILKVFGNINIVVARELTKIHEEVIRNKVSEAIKHFEENKPRGEFTILLCPKMVN